MARIRRVGFVGLGIMGAPMARNLREAGFELSVHTRTREKAERFAAEHGATFAATPADAAEGADAFITMVPDAPEVEQVLLGDGGAADALPEGALVVEVPNLAAVAARRMGLQWTHLDADVHVSQFTPATLHALLSAAGLEVTDLHTVAHGVYLTRRERWAAAHVVHRAKLARHGAIGLRDRHRHEFLRAVARRAR